MTLKQTFLKFILFIILVAFISQCSLEKQWRKGKVSHPKAVFSLPFDFSLGLIKIQVQMEGQVYNFILDSGAPTVIDDDIQAQCDFKSKYKANFRGVSGSVRKMEIIEIPEMFIDQLQLTGFRAAVTDFSHFTCMDIDGIIGTNIMQYYDWEIDFENHIITAYKNGIDLDQKKLDYAISLPLSYSAQKSPYINAKMGRWQLNRVLIDLGSRGGLHLKKWQGFNAQDFTQIDTLRGASSTGINGQQSSMNLFCVSDSLILDQHSINSQELKVNHFQSSSIGTKLLKQFRVILSYHHNLLLLQERQLNPISTTDGKVFLKWQDAQVLIQAIGSGYPNLKYQDTVVGFNQISFDTLSKTDYCKWKTKDDQIQSINIKKGDKILSLEPKKVSL